MTDYNKHIVNIINSNISIKRAIIEDKNLIIAIEKAAVQIINCYNNGGKVLLCGNGGSAADAQHIAAEFSGRFYFDRKSLAAEAIHVNTSYITAVANDYSFNDIYSRYIDGCGKANDVLIAISTSGNSENIIRAINTAKQNKMFTIALTGLSGGKMKGISDLIINVPSSDTPRIQESHILIGHIICEIVESNLFPKM
ncbi:MAG: phosphoheptose isomerase [Bacteroidetes bacterium GWA2_32_17]|nr:MAG: phosphoheptose isomerase [Bacteroidetes bacterium GWA2_32_17]